MPSEKMSPSPPARPLLAPCYEMFCRAALRWYCPLAVIGRDNLPPPPFVLCSNHASHMDTAVLMVATGLPFDRFAMLAARDYFFSGGRDLRQSPRFFTRLIPVDRAASRESVLRMIEQCSALTERARQSHYVSRRDEIDRRPNREIQKRRGVCFDSFALAAGAGVFGRHRAADAQGIDAAGAGDGAGCVWRALMSPADFVGAGGSTRMNAALRDSILRLRDDSKKARD